MTFLHRAAVIVALVVLPSGGCKHARQSSPATTQATSTEPSPAAPKRIAAARKLVFCSDLSYPPLESYADDTPVGADVDVATEIARRFGVQATFRDTRIEVVIASLAKERCDAAISALPVLARPGIAYVPYLRLGRALMVRRGARRAPTTLDELAGRRVAVELGSVDRDFLAAASRRLVARGMEPIHIHGYVDNGSAAHAVRVRAAGAFFGDFPVVARLVAAGRRHYALAGPQIAPRPVGIAVRREDVRVHAAIAREVAAMYRDGTMARILRRWSMSAAAYVVTRSGK